MSETDEFVDQFFQALDYADKLIDSVPEPVWGNQTPCEEWTALQVVSHLTGTLDKAIQMQSADGVFEEKPASPGQGSDVSETLQRWRSARDMVRDGMAGADLDEKVWAYGHRTRAETLALPTADLAVHSWDIAVATGLERELPRPLLESAKGPFNMPEEMWRQPGLFGPAVDAADDASDTDQLMAFLGRRAPR